MEWLSDCVIRFLLLGIQSLHINLSMGASYAQISLCGQGCSSETGEFMNDLSFEHTDDNSSLLQVFFFVVMFCRSFKRYKLFSHYAYKTSPF